MKNLETFLTLLKQDRITQITILVTGTIFGLALLVTSVWLIWPSTPQEPQRFYSGVTITVLNYQDRVAQLLIKGEIPTEVTNVRVRGEPVAVVKRPNGTRYIEYLMPYKMITEYLAVDFYYKDGRLFRDYVSVPYPDYFYRVIGQDTNYITHYLGQVPTCYTEGWCGMQLGSTHALTWEEAQAKFPITAYQDVHFSLQPSQMGGVHLYNIKNSKNVVSNVWLGKTLYGVYLTFMAILIASVLGLFGWLGLKVWDRFSNSRKNSAEATALVLRNRRENLNLNIVEAAANRRASGAPIPTIQVEKPQYPALPQQEPPPSQLQIQRLFLLGAGDTEEAKQARTQYALLTGKSSSEVMADYRQAYMSKRLTKS